MHVTLSGSICWSNISNSRGRWLEVACFLPVSNKSECSLPFLFLPTHTYISLCLLPPLPLFLPFLPLSLPLPPRLLILNEQIQVLEAAIEFKNDTILSRKATIDGVLVDSLNLGHTPLLQNHTPSLGEKLKVLKHTEVCELLEHYFKKVVELRVAEGNGRQVHDELTVQLEEEMELKRKAGALLGHVRLQGEKALATQQVVSSLAVKFHSSV